MDGSRITPSATSRIYLRLIQSNLFQYLENKMAQWHWFWQSLDDVRSADGLCLWVGQSLSLVAGLRWRTSAKEFVKCLCAVYIRTESVCHSVRIALFSSLFKESQRSQ